jgi:hypothetical protein
LPKAWSAYSLSNLTGLGSEADRLFKRKEKKKKGRRRGNEINNHRKMCKQCRRCILGYKIILCFDSQIGLKKLTRVEKG